MSVDVTEYFKNNQELRDWESCVEDQKRISIRYNNRTLFCKRMVQKEEDPESTKEGYEKVISVRYDFYIRSPDNESPKKPPHPKELQYDALLKMVTKIAEDLGLGEPVTEPLMDRDKGIVAYFKQYSTVDPVSTITTEEGMKKWLMNRIPGDMRDEAYGLPDDKKVKAFLSLAESTSFPLSYQLDRSVFEDAVLKVWLEVTNVGKIDVKARFEGVKEKFPGAIPSRMNKVLGLAKRYCVKSGGEKSWQQCIAYGVVPQEDWPELKDVSDVSLLAIMQEFLIEKWEDPDDENLDQMNFRSDVAKEHLARICEKYRNKKDSNDMRITESSLYNEPYRGKTASNLYDYINHCHGSFLESPSACRGPVLAIVQSSGMGKTRAVLEMAKQGNVYVIYASFGSPDANCVPAPSKNAPDMQKDYGDSRKSKAYILTCLLAVAYADGYVHPYDLVRKLAMADSSLWKALHKVFKTLESMHTLLKEEVMTSLAEKILSGTWESFAEGDIDMAIRGKLASLLVEVKSALGVKDKESPLSGSKPKLLNKTKALKVVCVFDEARTLQNDLYEFQGFVHLRRALRMVKSGAFGVYMDTNSSIEQLAPSNDPSARGIESRHFTPFYQFDTIDALRSPISEKWDENFEPTCIFSYGRPLWICYENFDYPLELIRFAKKKLKCGNEKDELNEAAMAAVLGCRIPLEILDVSLANKLVAGNMRVLRVISNDHSYVLTEHPSEPVLAEASADIMTKHTQTIGKFLAELIKTKRVNPGDAGEIASMLVSLLARDIASLSDNKGMENPYTRPITVLSFLQALFPKFSCKPTGLNPARTSAWERLMDAYISFSHFHRPKNHFPTAQDTRESFDRGMGYLARVNQSVVDVMIPVYYPDTGEVSLLVIQVRNHNKRTDGKFSLFQGSVKTLLSKTEHCYTEPALAIYMDFMQSESCNEDVHFRSEPARTSSRLEPSNSSLEVFSIYAGGCSPSIYPVGACEAAFKDLVGLIGNQFDPLFPGDYPNWRDHADKRNQLVVEVVDDVPSEEQETHVQELEQAPESEEEYISTRGRNKKKEPPELEEGERSIPRGDSERKKEKRYGKRTQVFVLKEEQDIPKKRIKKKEVPELEEGEGFTPTYHRRKNKGETSAAPKKRKQSEEDDCELNKKEPRVVPKRQRQKDPEEARLAANTVTRAGAANTVAREGGKGRK